MSEQRRWETSDPTPQASSSALGSFSVPNRGALLALSSPGENSFSSLLRAAFILAFRALRLPLHEGFITHALVMQRAALVNWGEPCAGSVVARRDPRASQAAEPSALPSSPSADSFQKPIFDKK